MINTEFLLNQKRNLIQIDKDKKDYSELERVIDQYNISGLDKPKTLWVAYKQDIENNIQDRELDHVIIHLEETFIKGTYDVLVCGKEVKHNVFDYKFQITKFVEKHF